MNPNLIRSGFTLVQLKPTYLHLPTYLPTYLPTCSRLQSPITNRLVQHKNMTYPHLFNGKGGWVFLVHLAADDWLLSCARPYIVAFCGQWGHIWCGIAVSLKMAKLQKTTPTFFFLLGVWNGTKPPFRIWKNIHKLYSRFVLKLDLLLVTWWCTIPLFRAGGMLGI
jgi:hypothetical protein